MKNKSVVLLLGMAGFIVMADNWVVSPILPAISDNLSISAEKAGLLISAYMIPFGVFQLVFGPLADRFGKKLIITVSMVFFTITTGLCALGTGLLDLSVYRGLTGLFAASVLPISLALIGDIFPIEERQAAGTDLLHPGQHPIYRWRADRGRVTRGRQNCADRPAGGWYHEGGCGRS